MHLSDKTGSLLGSLGIHLLILLFCIFHTHEQTLHRNFFVHATSSKEEGYAFYKPASVVGTYIPEAPQNTPKKKESSKTCESTTESKCTTEKLNTSITPPQKAEQTKNKDAVEEKKEITTLHQKQEIKKEAEQITKPPKPQKSIKEEAAQQKIHPLTKSQEGPHNTSGNKNNWLSRAPKKERIALYQAYIQQEIKRVWHPPVGIPKGTECSVYFQVNRTGQLASAKITHPSSVIVYNLSIQRVMSTCSFHQCLWGKSFTVTFRQ